MSSLIIQPRCNQRLFFPSPFPSLNLPLQRNQLLLPENISRNHQLEQNFPLLYILLSHLLFSCNFLIRVRYCVILSSLCLHFCFTKPGQYTSSSSICLTAFSRFLDNLTLETLLRIIGALSSYFLSKHLFPHPVGEGGALDSLHIEEAYSFLLSNGGVLHVWWIKYQ